MIHVRFVALVVVPALLMTTAAQAQTAAPGTAANPGPSTALPQQDSPAASVPPESRAEPEPPSRPVSTAPAVQSVPVLATAAPGVQSAWRTKLYGFIEFDAAHDTTQAYNDLGGWGSTALPLAYTYAGSHGRTQFTARNSRLGVFVNAPDYGGVRSSATLEADFMGNQPSDAAESALITNGAFRLRVASLLLQTDYVDVLAGQAWALFGFEPFFLPASPFLLPVPGEVFKRDAQVRVSHTFKSSGVDFEIGASANRPPQRDSEVPDIQAGLRLALNGWQGIHTPGTDGQRLVGPSRSPVTIAVSGAGRRFRTTNFQGTAAGTFPDPRSSDSATGYGLVADALIPVIPAASAEDRGNALTLTGQFSTGTGYADLLGGLVSNGGGPATPSAAYPAIPNSPDKYAPNIQSGLVTFDNTGNLHTIDWQTFLVGLQYYLPPSGRVSISGNFAQAHSGNVAKWADPGQVSSIYTKTRYFDANLFWDVTPAIRTALSYQYLEQQFAHGDKAHNVRTELSAFFFF